MTHTLTPLGWRPSLARQLADAPDGTRPARVMSVHRSGFAVAGDGFETTVPPDAETTVGDWLLLASDSDTALARLDRQSLLKRRAPGAEGQEQLIAANLDTLFITTSCNADFNPARLERYLALAEEAEITPIIVLTKADLCDTPGTYRRQAEALMPGLLAEPLNAKDPAQAARLKPWIGPGQTVAFAGSSGVGKSTLLNTLLGEATAATQAIREDDAKGRHTTSHRALFHLPQGGWLIDLPGMRELGLTDAATGIDAVFADLAALAQTCKFRDCAHYTEPGCAIQAAIAAGTLDPARLARWQKLQAEDRRNSETTAERHARDRAFGKMVKTAMTEKRR